MKVVFSSRARADLRAIALYIARDNVIRARSFIAELRATTYDIANFPEGYPLVPRHERAGIRRRAYRDYLIFYTVDASIVRIVHIAHGAQDYSKPYYFDWAYCGFSRLSVSDPSS